MAEEIKCQGHVVCKANELLKEAEKLIQMSINESVFCGEGTCTYTNKAEEWMEEYKKL